MLVSDGGPYLVDHSGCAAVECDEGCTSPTLTDRWMEVKWEDSYEATSVAQKKDAETPTCNNDLGRTGEFGWMLNYRRLMDGMYNFIQPRQKVKFEMTWRFTGYEVELRVTN